MDNPKSHAFNIVIEQQNATVGHAEIVLDEDGTGKIDKLIVGDPSHRGKGLCQQVIKELMAFAFTNLPIHTIELNVFDWNSSAIRCYEKVGFKFNSAKKRTFEINDQKWVTVNMSIRKSN